MLAERKAVHRKGREDREERMELFASLRVLCGVLFFVAFQRFAGKVIERVSQHAKHND
jgi:hypothetical protein